MFTAVGATGGVVGDAVRCAIALALDISDVGEGSRLPLFGGLFEGVASFGGLVLFALVEVVIGGINFSEKLPGDFELVDAETNGATAAGAWISLFCRRDIAICRLATLMLLLRMLLLVVVRSVTTKAPAACVLAAQIASLCCCCGETHCLIMAIVVGSNCLDGSKAETKRIRGPCVLWFAPCTTTEKRSAASSCLRVGRRCWRPSQGQMKWKRLRPAFSTNPFTHSSWQCSGLISCSATSSSCSSKLKFRRGCPRGEKDNPVF